MSFSIIKEHAEVLSYVMSKNIHTIEKTIRKPYYNHTKTIRKPYDSKYFIFIIINVL